MCATSIPASVAAAEWLALKPSIGRVIRLIKRWSCSTIFTLEQTSLLCRAVVEVFGLNDVDGPTSTREFEDGV